MIKKQDILNALDSAGLSDVEILKDEDNHMLLSFFYDFEEEEFEAAKSFAENEDDEDMEEEDEGFEGEDEEYYGDSTQKYLTEIAVDYVGEVLEDIRDDLEIGVQYVGYDMGEDSQSYEFVALFYEEDSEMDIDDILDEMDI